MESAVVNTMNENDEKGSGTSEQRRRELADFLRTRREKLKPEQVGMSQGSRRRTPGLRREEVAELAGVGTTWYTWLEQARDIQPSSEVLRRLGLALQLNPAELRHMFTLAGKVPPADLEAGSESVTESMHRLINESLTVPAVLVGGRWDVLAANAPARKLFHRLFEAPPEKQNWVYYIFCGGVNSRGIVQNWEQGARRVLAEFRASLSDSLDNPWVLELVNRLKEESGDFAQWWREHDVRDNAPATLVFTTPEDGARQFERVILKPWENMRYKILVFTPLEQSN